MWEATTRKLLLFSYLFMVIHSSNSQESSESRHAKHFSLFSVVTFKNDECTSLSTLAGGARSGTCYSTSECSDKKGTASGNCASGFGVCCLFLNTGAATVEISENRTHLRNSEFPTYASATTAVSIVYTVKKMHSDICQIRLDFLNFIIGGPTVTTEAIGGTTTAFTTLCGNDNLVVATTSGKQRGTICGAMTGEHMYLELSPTSTDSATLTLATATTPAPATAQRVWDIKASQIPCYASYRAPAGCERYLMTDTGKITSFNFYKVSGSTLAVQASAAGQNTGLELALQNINTCIRRSKGMCCVQYQVCAADTQGIKLTQTTGTTSDIGTEGDFSEGWSIDTDTHPFILKTTQDNGGLVDSLCSGDYVEIPSSFSGACGGGTGSAANAINTRYCGSKLGANWWSTTADTAGTPVCDCSEPFHVRHVTDTSNDTGGAVGVNIANHNAITPGRGFCLDFRQMPCWQR